MEKTKNYPWRGCGANKEITGCRFSLSVMSDDFANIILSALRQVDTSKVWSQTDLLSTIYRGKSEDVVNTLRDCFVQVNDGQTHITLEATFSKGCPGDVDEDFPLAEDISENISEKTTTEIKGKGENEKPRKTFSVLSKISFYPLGRSDYMEYIAAVVNRAMEKGIYKGSSHYATELEGDVHDVFDYFQEVLAYAKEHLDHYVLQATLSVNSPSKRNVS